MSAHSVSVQIFPLINIFKCILHRRNLSICLKAVLDKLTFSPVLTWEHRAVESSITKVTRTKKTTYLLDKDTECHTFLMQEAM